MKEHRKDTISLPNTPKVSFLMPVLNGGRLFHQALKSIKMQSYPQERIEIIMADGGSRDDTVKIAKDYGCKIIKNPYVAGDIGLDLCFEVSTGDLNVALAADNELPNKDWLQNMVTPFLYSDVIGTYTQIIPSPNTSSINRYYSLLHVEPFTWFVYGNSANPRSFMKEYQIHTKGSNYYIFEFTVKDHPLIALAQGIMLRKDFRRRREYRGDDILPIIEMIEKGLKFAYVPDCGIYHHHIESFSHYIKKYRWRICNSLYDKKIGFSSRHKYLSFKRKLKKYLWIAYGGIPIFSLIDSLKWYLKDREKCWFWHIPASMVLSYMIIYEVIKKTFFNKINKK